MREASLIWTSRTWPQTGSLPPVLTVPPEQPGWSSEASGAAATPIPAKGFLAAIFDSPRGETSVTARRALEQAWNEVNEAQVSNNLSEVASRLAREVETASRPKQGSASLSALLVLVQGDTMAWSNHGESRLFFCHAGGTFEDLTSDGTSSEGRVQLSPGDLLILGNSGLVRQTAIEGQAGDIENITEDNADGWLESLLEQADRTTAVTFCMIGVRSFLPTTSRAPIDVGSVAGPTIAALPAREVVEVESTSNQPADAQARTATSYPAAPGPSAGARGFPRGGIIATALLVALLGVAAIYMFLRDETTTTPTAASPTQLPDDVALPAETQSTEAPAASPTEAAVTAVAVTPVPDETAVATATRAPATATVEPEASPTIGASETEPPAAAPRAPSPAVIFGAFDYPRLLDDTGYNNSVEFLTTLFGPPGAEDPAYVAYIRDYVTSNPDARCPSGAVIWFCLGGREIPDMVPAPAWVAFTGEIMTASDSSLMLRAGTQTYAITDVQELAADGPLTIGNLISIIGRVDNLTWDPATPTGARVERAGAAIPVAAAFARSVSNDGTPAEWQRGAAPNGEANRPMWLYSSDRELLSEIIEQPPEAAEALAQGNVLIQGTLDQSAGASPRIEIRAVYSLDLNRNRYVCRYGELPDATCP